MYLWGFLGASSTPSGSKLYLPDDVCLNIHWNSNLHFPPHIFHSHLFLSQLKSSFFLHHPSKTALSKVSNNPWIVRCNDFFSAFIWFQVYVSWTFWVLPVWNFAVYAITLRSSSSVDNLSESFTASFRFIYLNLFLKSRCQDKVLFFCPHLSLHNTIFVRS